MKFIASINTTIYGDKYLQGQTIDLTGWTRKQILQFLGNGLISAQQLTSGDVAAAIEVAGVGVTTAVNPVTDRTTVTVDMTPQQLDWLTDVDLGVAPTNGQVLSYQATTSMWKAATPTGGGSALWASTVRQTAGQSILTTVYTPDWTYLDFGVQEEGTTGWTSGDPKKLILPSTGQYAFSAGWAHDGASGSNVDTIMGVKFYNANGSVVTASLAEDRVLRPYSGSATVSGSVKCTAAGQYMRVYVFQTTGSTRTTIPGNCFLSAHRTS